MYIYILSRKSPLKKNECPLWNNMDSIGKFLGLEESKPFEHPKHNGIWKPVEWKRILTDYGLVNSAAFSFARQGCVTKT